MGIFSKTEEEIKREEENKRLKYLISLVSDAEGNDTIEYESAEFLKEYIESLRRGRVNDFDDLDTLYIIINKLLDEKFYTKARMQDHLERVIELYKKMVPKEHPDRENIKSDFIENYVGKDGLILSGLYDDALFALFENKNDYYEVMRVVLKSPIATLKFDIVKDYIKKVCKYCLTQDILKRDIIAFIAGLENVEDGKYEKYVKEELENAKRRIGVYSLSPKELAECESKLRKMGNYIERYNILLTSLKDEKAAITSLVDSGKKEIHGETTKSIEELRGMIREQKNALMEKLDKYLEELEAILKDRSDATFSEILETYKNQVEEFGKLFRSYSRHAGSEFLRIQKTTEESIKKLEDYVANEPGLQELLTRAQEQNQVREKIVELVTKEEELLDKMHDARGTDDEQVLISGYNRVMVPYRHIILPEEIPTEIIGALDDSIPFDKRLEKVEEAMRRREEKGEIFHKKTEEILIDIMEGDWPYLWGPSGTGKSYMAKQVASLLGMTLTKAGKITEPHSVLGYNDPQGRFRITPTFIAALYGHLLSLDEFDNGNPDTQVVLNDIYSELLNKLENPDETCEVIFGTDVPVDIHPNFRMIAAGNTSGSGENSVFSSRGKIDESIQERMTPVYIDYDDRVEEMILSDYPAWYKFFIDFRNACIKFADTNGIEAPQGITTTRDAAAIKKYIEHNSKSVDQVIAEKFVQTKDSEYRKALGKIIAQIYGIDYNNCREPKYDGPLAKAEEKVLAKKFIMACKKGVK